eukprot:1916345-Pleurochrysis_carterae.AAC.1
MFSPVWPCEPTQRSGSEFSRRCDLEHTISELETPRFTGRGYRTTACIEDFKGKVANNTFDLVKRPKNTLICKTKWVYQQAQ